MAKTWSLIVEFLVSIGNLVLKIFASKETTNEEEEEEE